jgi:hypothetical protein
LENTPPPLGGKYEKAERKRRKMKNKEERGKKMGKGEVKG